MRRPGSSIALGRQGRRQAPPPATGRIGVAPARTLAAGQALVLAVYTLTMFLSAALLFALEPMFAKLVLPLLGGSPAVWNTALVFYQVTLLAGYLYAHLTTRWLGVRGQALLHIAVVLVPLIVLPISIPAGWRPPTEGNPIPWLLALLSVAVGLPLFVVSTTSPLLQAWFARTGHRQAGDPYFLYAASNVGSLLALIAYPTVIELHLRLTDQRWLWTVGYLLLAVLTGICAAIMWWTGHRRQDAPPAQTARAAEAVEATAPRPLGRARPLRWILLAFVPSSLMVSVTTYLSTTIAPIPLIWVIPLSLYLLTFILAFSSRTARLRRVMIRSLPVTVVLLAFVMATHLSEPISLVLVLHLAVFFIAAMVCHGTLAADRPAAAQLTTFYVFLSVGGALGGMFNALLAPLLFRTVTEYPLVLILLCLVYPGRSQPQRGRPWVDGACRAALAVLALAVALGGPDAVWHLPAGAVLLLFCAGMLMCMHLTTRPVRFAAGVAAVFVLGNLVAVGQGIRVLHAERSFFGVHRVLDRGDGGYHAITHGDTLHGMQSLDPARRREPLTYYTTSGPIGQVFAALDGAAPPRRVAVIGLGAGALSCYRQPGQDWTFYEIDPAVVRIAQDPRYFTYLRECAPDAGIVLGDARLSLAKAAPAQYDLIVLDAFTSDAPPVHLLDKEAVALYLEKLAPNGLLAFHISNRYLDLRPVVANLAGDAGLVGLRQEELEVSADDAAHGKTPSRWTILARTAADLAGLAEDARWQRLTPDPGLPLWTDDFSSIVSVLRH